MDQQLKNRDPEKSLGILLPGSCLPIFLCYLCPTSILSSL